MIEVVQLKTFLEWAQVELWNNGTELIDDPLWSSNFYKFHTQYLCRKWSCNLERWEWNMRPILVMWHGNCHFRNVIGVSEEQIEKTKPKLFPYGDIYYDLASLRAGYALRVESVETFLKYEGVLQVFCRKKYDWKTMLRVYKIRLMHIAGITNDKSIYDLARGENING